MSIEQQSDSSRREHTAQEKHPQYWRKKEEVLFEPAEVDEAIHHTEDVLAEAEKRKDEVAAAVRESVMTTFDQLILRSKEVLQRAKSEQSERLYEEKLQTFETIKRLTSEISQVLQADLGDLSKEEWEALVGRLKQLRETSLSNKEAFEKYRKIVGSDALAMFTETPAPDFVVEQGVRRSLPWAARKLKPEWDRVGRERFSTDLIAPDNAADFSGYHLIYEIVPTDLAAEAERQKKDHREMALEWMDLPEDVKQRELQVSVALPDRWRTLGDGLIASVKEDASIAAKSAEYERWAEQVRGRSHASPTDFLPLMREIDDAAAKASRRAHEQHRAIGAVLEDWPESDVAKGLRDRIAANEKRMGEARSEEDRLEAGFLSRVFASSRRKELKKEIGDMSREAGRLREELGRAAMEHQDQTQAKHGDRRVEVADERGQLLRRLGPANVYGF